VDARVTSGSIDKELRRRQLAQRLTVHQARTQTIFLLTGLSRHQLATMRQRWHIPQEMRHRGPPPTSYSVFRTTLLMREEAAVLGVLWKLLGDMGVRKNGAHERTFSVELGERLCAVFEVYLACFPNGELEFEHLVLLMRGLDDGDAIALSTCEKCTAVVLVDLLGTRRRLCSHCQQLPSACNTPDADSGGGPSTPVQHNLF
jgi:hypothetical protein